MNNELENLIITIDTHEEANRTDKTRTKLIESWALAGNAVVEHRELGLCDYSIEGDFRDRYINLGIEYKAWDNYLTDPTDDMEDKITRSQEQYSEVAFFLEAGNYTFKPKEDSSHCILNFSEIAKAGFRKRGIVDLLPSKTLAGMEGFLETMSLNGVHVRQLRSESQFPFSVYNLLIYLTNPHKLKVKEQRYENWLQNLYMSIPEIGYVKAKELISNYPNPFWLCSASEESLVNVLGKTTGRVTYQHLRSHELETDSWKQGYHKDGTEAKDSDICESTACQRKGILELPCDEKGYSKICKYPTLQRKLAKERGYPMKKKSVPKPLPKPAELKPLSEDEKKHQNFKLWKANGFPQTPSYPIEGTIFNPTHSHLAPSIANTSGNHTKGPDVITCHSPDTGADLQDPLSANKTPQTSPVEGGGIHSLPSPTPSTPTFIPACKQSFCLNDAGSDGYCSDSQCIENRKCSAGTQNLNKAINSNKKNTQDILDNKEPKNRANLKTQLEQWFRDGKPHSLNDTVAAYSEWDKEKVLFKCMTDVNAGKLKRITDAGTSTIYFQKV